MFKNFWYAIQHGSKVGDQPMKLKVMGQDLVIWRNDAGAPVVQSDLCVHRGGSLAGGHVQRGANGHNCVVCPYHGWQFDDEGACVRIPAARPDVAIPRKGDAGLPHHLNPRIDPGINGNPSVWDAEGNHTGHIKDSDEDRIYMGPDFFGAGQPYDALVGGNDVADLVEDHGRVVGADARV